MEKKQVFEKRENWPLCKGYNLCKMVTLGPRLKLPETLEKRLYNHIRVVLCKITLKKTPDSGLMEVLEKGKHWLLCKGYSLCELVTLGPGLKFPETFEKRLYNHIRFVLWKKTAQEKARYWRNSKFLQRGKIGHYAKAIAFLKSLLWGQN